MNEERTPYISEEAGVVVCNIDKVVTKKRLIRISENPKWKIFKCLPFLRRYYPPRVREIDVSRAPSRVILELMQEEQFMSEQVKQEDDALFSSLIDKAIKICRPSFPEITKEWILDNMSFEELMAFLKFAMKPLNDYLDGMVEEAAKKIQAVKAKVSESESENKSR